VLDTEDRSTTALLHYKEMRLCFYIVSVSLSGDPLDYSKSRERILMNFLEGGR